MPLPEIRICFASAPVVTGATLEIDVASDAVDKLVVEAPFDLSPLTLRVPSFADWTGPADRRQGTLSGTCRTACGMRIITAS